MRLRYDDALFANMITIAVWIDASASIEHVIVKCTRLWVHGVRHCCAIAASCIAIYLLGINLRPYIHLRCANHPLIERNSMCWFL